MSTRHLILSFTVLLFCACQDNIAQESPSDQQEEKVAQQSKGIHSYGGWYCPDNLSGFPPVNVADLSSVSVVEGRLPTKEEASNGTSLMYFDPNEIPDARPLEMDLPQLATYYSMVTEQYETVIVIQAVVAGLDTVVGFRFPSGGNGSAWHRIMDFHGKEEKAEDAPFVFIDTELPYSQLEIWEAFSQTQHASELGKRFDKTEYFGGAWKENISTHLEYEADAEKGKGVVSTMWGSIYMQIDYSIGGEQMVEKFFVMENENGDSSKVQIVAGPFPSNFDQAELNWSNTFKELEQGLN